MKSTDAGGRRYPVNEIFCSLQGEGFHTGTAAVFVRMSGCNRACAFCDTDFSRSTMMTAAEIAAEAAAYTPRHLVLTGGEPTLTADSALCAALKEAGFFIQIETNGSLPVPPEVDWVTCSPKTEPYAIDRIDELKIVFQDNGEEVERLRERFGSPERCFLQPCSGLNTASTVEWIVAHPWWRLSLQTHKLIDIR